MVIIGGLGAISGSFFGAAFIVILPIFLNQTLPLVGSPAGTGRFDRAGFARRIHHLRFADRVFPDRRTAWHRPAVGDREGEAAVVALPPIERQRRNRRVLLSGRRRSGLLQAKHPIILGGEKMKLRKLAVTASLAAIGLSAALTAPATYAAEEQFFPVLAYRTGAYAPNGAPWANGYVDYLKLTNARGGVNGVKIISKNAKPATPPTAVSSATSA
jgi:hypothetical protein